MISGPMPSPRATVMGTGFAMGAQLIIVAVSLDDGIRELVRRLRSKPRVTVVTGAGVSAASGVPTFRGGTASDRHFLTDQDCVTTCQAGVAYGRGSAWWTAPRSRRSLAEFQTQATRDARGVRPGPAPGVGVVRVAAGARRPRAPNRAHEVLATWSRRYEGFTLVTQNVDGLHERAGTAT